MLWFLCFASNVFVNFETGSGIECTHNMPCNYSYGLSHCVNGSRLVITDSKISEPERLHELQEVFESAISVGANIDGSGVIVNGMKVATRKPGFIFIQDAWNFTFTRFTFKNFHSPIVTVRGCEYVELSNSVIRECQISGSMGLLVLGVTDFCLNGVEIYNNTIYKTSLISMHSGKYVVANSTIHDNAITHVSRNPMLEVTNGLLEFVNSSVYQNECQQTALIICDFEGEIDMYNSFLHYNKCTELVLCEEGSHLNCTNCSICHNHGAVLHLVSSGSFDASDCEIQNNTADGSHLISCRTSEINMNTSILTGNKGDGVIEFGGWKSKGTFLGVAFLNNTVSQSTMELSNNSYVSIEQCSFSGNSADVDIHVDESNLALIGTVFNDTTVHSMDIHKGNVHIERVSFHSNLNPMIKADSETNLVILSCSFDSVVTESSVIDVTTLNVRLENLTFSQTRRNSIEKYLEDLCLHCVFRPSLFSMFMKCFALSSVIVLVNLRRLKRVHLRKRRFDFQRDI